MCVFTPHLKFSWFFNSIYLFLVLFSFILPSIAQVSWHVFLAFSLKEESLRGRPGYEHLNDPLHIIIEAELPANIVDMRLRQAKQIIEELLKPMVSFLTRLFFITYTIFSNLWYLFLLVSFSLHILLPFNHERSVFTSIVYEIDFSFPQHTICSCPEEMVLDEFHKKCYEGVLYLLICCLDFQVWS